VRRFATELPPTAPLALGSGAALAVSPDGSRLAYVARRGERTQLFMRTLDQLEPSPIAGTEDGTSPFFSPGGDWLGFSAEGKLKKLDLTGGTPLTVGDSPIPRGASWGEGETTIFAPLTTGGLVIISASEPQPEILSSPDVEAGEKSHRWPDLLPNNRAVIFTAWTSEGFDIECIDMESGERKSLVREGTYARYVPTGHLVFVRSNALWAVPFDSERLEVTGPAVSVVDNVLADPLTGGALYSIDQNGLLVYAPGGSESYAGGGTGRLLWANRQGVPRPVAEAQRRSFQLPRLSPDGRRLIVTIAEEDDTNLWILELDRGPLGKLTFKGSNGAAVWSPDGRSIAFNSDRDGSFNLYRMATDGSGQVERLTTSDNVQIPTSWSPDGRTLAFVELSPTTGFDIWILPMEGKSTPQDFLRAPFSETGATFSPNGKWIAYVSDETGRSEVYVKGYPEGGKWPVSTEGGDEPVWAPHGRELFYRNQEWMMGVSLETEPQFSLGKPTLLFETAWADDGEGIANYDISKNGQEFIMIRSEEESAATRLIFVLNWFDELKRLVPTN
jgi:serine/threonine-protein kinase